MRGGKLLQSAEIHSTAVIKVLLVSVPRCDGASED